MKRFNLFLISSLVLCGCATSSQTYAPDGRVAYSLNCSGLALTWGSCLEKAGSICAAQGYDIISATSDRGAIANVNDANAFAGTTISRSMLISCNK